MNRLVAFGCSHTYGVALNDCWIDVGGPGDLPPSKLAWPNIMAKSLKLECINTSTPGSSNREIWWRIINFKFEPDDLILVQWTYPNRDCIIKQDDTIDQLAVWKEDYISKFLTLTHDNHDRAIEANTYIHHANILVPNIYNFSTDIRTLNPIPSWQTTKILFDMNSIYITSDKAIDGEHGNESFHEDLAQQYLSII